MVQTSSAEFQSRSATYHDIKPINAAKFTKTLPQHLDHAARSGVNDELSFIGLSIGLIAAVALIYLLLVVNFQSWLDPFIILTALTVLSPVANHKEDSSLPIQRLSVPAMMGAIMCMGVATANTVLVMTCARSSMTDMGSGAPPPWEAGTDCAR